MHMHPLIPFFRRYPTPRFAFTDAERILLRTALDGTTDDGLALALGIPLSAVKQRWVRLFSRVLHLPGVDFSTGIGASERRTRRAQRRHVLLRYLRSHPEELAEYKPSRLHAARHSRR